MQSLVLLKHTQASFSFFLQEQGHMHHGVQADVQVVSPSPQFAYGRKTGRVEQPHHAGSDISDLSNHAHFTGVLPQQP